jgi:methionyl-tRNA formyltransferase
MKTLLLSPYPELLEPYLDNFETASGYVTPEFISEFDIVVSYGYRHILKKEHLTVPSKDSNRQYIPVINLHISYLPWNKGADPNFWSWYDDTPKGVTIHYMDEGIDTGDIIVQRIVKMDEDETLQSSYNKLQEQIRYLFRDNWRRIRKELPKGFKQEGKGSYHNQRDFYQIKASNLRKEPSETDKN